MKTVLKILFAPFIWLLHACSPLGDHVDEEKSDSHFYTKDKTDISYSPMGNWFEIQNSPMHADVESFKVLSRYISKDKNRAYYRHNPIEHEELDLENLYIKVGQDMDDIAFDENNVYTFERIYGAEQTPAKVNVVVNADPKTYISFSYDWSKDATQRFYRNQVIEVDYDSFENINRTFSKDSARVYAHYEKHFANIEANVLEFKVLDEGSFAMDNLHVFSMTYSDDNSNGTKLVSIPKTIDEKVSLLNDVFLKIGKRIFYRGTQLPDLDPNYIEIINFSYIKDKNHVYYKSNKLEEADAATFSKKGKWDIGDKNGLFRDGRRVKN